MQCGTAASSLPSSPPPSARRVRHARPWPLPQEPARPEEWEDHWPSQRRNHPPEAIADAVLAIWDQAAQLTLSAGAVRSRAAPHSMLPHLPHSAHHRAAARPAPRQYGALPPSPPGTAAQPPRRRPQLVLSPPPRPPPPGHAGAHPPKLGGRGAAALACRACRCRPCPRCLGANQRAVARQEGQRARPASVPTAISGARRQRGHASAAARR